MSKKKPAVQTARLPSQTTEQQKTDQPPKEQPKTEQPPVEQPNPAQPPVEQPPADQPPLEQAPTQEVPQIDPIEKQRKGDLVAAIEARRKAACGE